MAVVETNQTDVNFRLKAGGVFIGGQDGATMTVTRSLEGRPTKDDKQWDRNKPGLRGYQISYTAMRLAGGDQLTGISEDGLKVEVSDDGGSTYTELVGLTEASLNLSLETNDNASTDTAPWESYLPGIRSHSLEVAGTYFDPASTKGAGYKIVLDQDDANAAVTIRLTFGNGTQYVGSYYVENEETGYDDGTATFSLSFAGDDAITRTDGDTYAIGSVDDVNDKIVVTGNDLTGEIEKDDLIRVDGHPTHDGYHTVTAVALNTSDTEITVSTDLTDTTASGNVILGPADEGFAALIDAFFSDPASTVDALIENVDIDGTTISGGTKRSGKVYPTEISIAVPFASDVEISGTLQGTGALTRAAQA